MNQLAATIGLHGFRVIPARADVVDGCPHWPDSFRTHDKLRRGAGVRNLLFEDAVVREWSFQLASSACVRSVLGNGAHPVRALYFDKTPSANWKVPWHQDLSIAVAERREVPGFTGWSLKEGVWHVQPPAKVLERMITLRLHLDDCGPDNGPLRVIPGSHREGRLGRERIEWWKTHGEIVECHVPVGGALLMRPLLLHSSSPARQPSHRRVLHIEFAMEVLPVELRWVENRRTASHGEVNLFASTPTPTPERFE